MKSQRLLVVSLVLVIAAAAIAAPRGTEGNIKWGKDDGHCRIGVTKFPTTVVAGESIQGSLIIENTGKDPIPVVLHPNEPLGQITISASLDQTERVDLTSFGKGGWRSSGSSREGVIRPGKRFEMPVALSRVLDMSRSGKYEIKFKFNYSPDGPGASTQPDSAAKSPTLTIEVDEHEE